MNRRILVSLGLAFTLLLSMSGLALAQQATPTAIAEEEPVATPTPVAEEEAMPEATATPVAEEEAMPEATATPIAEEEPAATPVAPEEPPAPVTMPATGGDFGSNPLIFVVVAAAVAALVGGVWASRRRV